MRPGSKIEKSTKFSFLALLFLVLASAARLDATPLELSVDGSQALYPFLSVLEDPAGRLTPDRAAADEMRHGYQSGFDHPPGFGMSPSVFWVRFRLENQTPRKNWLLVLKLPRLESGKLYRLTASGPRLIGRTGLVVPFERRSYPHRDNVLRIHQESGTSAEYLLRIRSRIGPLVMPFRVSANLPFAVADQWEGILLGLYFGALTVMAVYNLLLFFILRDRAFLYYSLFVCGFGFLMILSRGLHRPYLWTGSLSAEIQAIPLLSHLVILLAFVVMYYFFKAETREDRVGRLNRWLIIVYAAMTLLALLITALGYDNYLRNSFIASVALMPVFVFGISFWRLRQGHRAALYFGLAWAFLLAGAVSSMLVTRGLLPYNLLTYNGVLLASVIEMTLLSVGLADRVRRIEHEAERLRLASDTKTRFLAHMSHEIRTPLNAVLGMSELLRETRLSGEQGKYLNVLARAGRNLLDIINDILDISKIEAGHLQLELIRFRPATLVESLLEIFAPEAEGRGLELSAQIEEDLPEFLYGDPTRLRQVLSNLISNAIKFTESGYVRVRVGRLKAAKNPDGAVGRKTERLEFEVADSGIGIDLEKWELIFDSFSQADESTTRKYGGTGLGLTICRSLVKLMGGRIAVESFPGKGSRFYFALNFAAAPQDTGEPDRVAVADESGETTKSLSLLLAEDNPDNRLLFEAFLKKTPHRIDTAENGAVALRLFKEQAYDLVFMDIQMPVLSGLEAVKEIRLWERAALDAGERSRAVPIYALTAHALDHQRQESLAAGCDGHLSKPLEKEVLLDVLRGFRG